jgi:hypothetical protein
MVREILDRKFAVHLLAGWWLPSRPFPNRVGWRIGTKYWYDRPRQSGVLSKDQATFPTQAPFRGIANMQDSQAAYRIAPFPVSF